VLTLSERLRALSVDLVSLKSSPPSLSIVCERLKKPQCVHLRLHLVALGNLYECGLLITLGDCHRLAGLVLVVDHGENLGDCWCLRSLAIVRDLCSSPGEIRQEKL